MLARSAVVASRSATPAKVAGSVVPTPKTSPARNRPSHRAASAPSDHAGRDQRQPLAEHRAHDLLGARAERHPDADLLAPLHHHVADDGIEAQRREHQRQHGEDAEERHGEPAVRERLRPPRPPACAPRRAAGCGRARPPPGAARARCRADLRSCARGDRPIPPDAARAGCRSSARRLVERLLPDVSDHADDLLHPAGVPAEVDALAERALAGEVALREGLVDDDHRRRAGDVALVEDAPGEDRRAQHLEVARRGDPLLGEGLRLPARILAALDAEPPVGSLRREAGR